MQAMQALMIEDHQLVSASFETMLHALMPDLTLDKARDARAAVRLAGAIEYQLILLDWWVAGQDGEQTIRQLRAAGSSAPIVVVSGDESELLRRRARALGVNEWVGKSASPSALIDAIRRALGGVRPPDGAGTVRGEGRAVPAIEVRAVFMKDAQADRADDVRTCYPELTKRQAEVFRALMRGLSNKEIANRIGVAETTVKTHVRAVLQVVGVHRRGAAVYEARVRGAGGGA